MYQQAKFLYKLPVRLPWYDNWMLPSDTRHHFEHADPFLIGVVTLDNENCTNCGRNCKCEICPCRFTTIDIEEDFDKYKLRPVVLDYFREHKETCLYPDAIYNISLFADDVQVDPKHLSFDGRYFKFPNTLGADRIYRVVLCKTPEKKEGINPWFFVLECIIIADVAT